MRLLCTVLGEGVFVSPALEVLGHRICMGAAIRAEGELLQRVRYGSILVDHVEAGLSFWFLGPLHQSVPIFALAGLATSNLMLLVDGGHGSIISKAHDVLSQSVQTMIYVPRRDSSVCVSPVESVEVGATNIFQAVDMMEGLQVVQPLRLVPRKWNGWVKVVTVEHRK